MMRACMKFLVKQIVDLGPPFLKNMRIGSKGLFLQYFNMWKRHFTFCDNFQIAFVTFQLILAKHFLKTVQKYHKPNVFNDIP